MSYGQDNATWTTETGANSNLVVCPVIVDMDASGQFDISVNYVAQETVTISNIVRLFTYTYTGQPAAEFLGSFDVSGTYTTSQGYNGSFNGTLADSATFKSKLQTAIEDGTDASGEKLAVWFAKVVQSDVLDSIKNALTISVMQTDLAVNQLLSTISFNNVTSTIDASGGANAMKDALVTTPGYVTQILEQISPNSYEAYMDASSENLKVSGLPLTHGDSIGFVFNLKLNNVFLDSVDKSNTGDLAGAVGTGVTNNGDVGSGANNNYAASASPTAAALTAYAANSTTKRIGVEVIVLKTGGTAGDAIPELISGYPQTW
jgi:hypothetical protein